jgi:hypothetical protein
MGVIIGFLVAYIAYKHGYSRGFCDACEDRLMLGD